MRRTRQVLAVMVIATALCADRGIASPSGRPVVESTAASFAGRLMNRLSRGFGGSASVLLPQTVVRSERIVAQIRRLPASQGDDLPHPPISPFQFRLPPPTV